MKGYTAPEAPIIFKSPGLDPDVRLKVFEHEFHVHSVVLKLHSNYFRCFLDSPDKLGTSVSSSFRYNYISMIDPDGTWELESVEKVCRSPRYSSHGSSRISIEHCKS